eukprot:6491743-Amphidinium_carterae.1
MQPSGSSELHDRCQHGLLVKFHGVLSDGQPRPSVWKAWSRGSELRWALHRVLHSTGFRPTKHLPEHTCLKRSFPAWSACWSKLELGQSVGGISRRAIQARGGSEQEIASAEQEYWTNTPGLVALLAHMAATKRSLADRASISCVLHAFIARCCPAEFAVCAATSLPDMSVRQNCSEGLDEENFCEHMRAVLQAREGDHPQAKVANLVLQALLQVDCAAVRSFAMSHLLALGKAIDGNAESFAEFDYHKTSDAFVQGPRKRRRSDEHTRQWTTRAVTEGHHQTHAEATRALCKVPKQTGLKWTKDEIALYRASCHLSFRPMSALGLVLDASRVGKPAKELLVCCVSCPTSNSHAVLPVQVQCMK